MVFQQNLLKKSYFVAKMSGPAGQFLLLESALSFSREIYEKAVSSVSDTGGSKELRTPNRRRTYDVLVTSPGGLPLSYRRLMGAKATKLGSCDKHPAWCLD